MTERLVPGDVVVESLTIINSGGKRLDITNLMVQLDLYENIMSPFITGRITITDSFSLASIFPLIGEEMLIVKMESPFSKVKYEKVFFIYKMSNKENLAMKNSMFSLYFASAEFFTDINTKLSQKFSGNISDIVNTIATSPSGLKTQKNVLVEKTKNSEIYVSNFWSPTQNLYYLTSKAIGEQGNPNYVFFEGNDGFVFASLDKLYTQNSNNIFTKNQKTSGTDGTIKLEEEYTKIIDMSTPVMYDYIERIETGVYGGAAYQYDLTYKNLNFRYLIGKEDVKYEKMNKNLVENTKSQVFDPLSNLKTKITQKELFKGRTNVPVTHDIRRMSSLSRLDSIKTNIQIFGLFDYGVGKKYELDISREMPETKEMTEDDVKDETLSGFYLCTALHHSITRKEHICNMELSKESFDKDLFEK